MAGSLIVAGLFEPALGDGFKSGNDARELGAFEHRCGHEQSDHPVGALNPYGLQIRLLETVLLGCSEFPLARVTMPNMLGVVRLLAADLTDPCHGICLEMDTSIRMRTRRLAALVE